MPNFSFNDGFSFEIPVLSHDILGLAAQIITIELHREVRLDLLINTDAIQQRLKDY